MQIFYANEPLFRLVFQMIFTAFSVKNRPFFAIFLIPIHVAEHILICMQYFGTDGIRQKADYLLDKQIPYLLGKVLSQTGAKVIVARDVRTHSKEIEKQLCKGLLEGSAQIWLAGVLPTPALAYTAQTQKADYAVMITASHNAPEFNGLKVFGKHGKKLSKEEEIALDDKLVELKNNPTPPVSLVDVCADALTEDEKLSELKITVSAQNHRIRIVDGAEFLYAKHIKSMFPRFDGVKVRLDCAYGCFATLAPAIFLSLGAIVCAEHNVRDGEKVNVNCGSTHIESFAKRVSPDEFGFAFDGDGDRVIAVVNGKIYDGDAMLLALSTLYRLQGKLKKRFIVGTVLSNTKLQRELAYQNVALVRADVGDKNVLDALLAHGCMLGGEKKRAYSHARQRKHRGRTCHCPVVAGSKAHRGQSAQIHAVSDARTKRLRRQPVKKFGKRRFSRKNKQSQRSVRKIGQAYRASERNRTVHQNNLRMFFVVSRRNIRRNQKDIRERVNAQSRNEQPTKNKDKNNR